jgi:DNA gyrase subunit B
MITRFPQLIQGGHVYAAQPPLYMIGKGKEVRYAYKEDQKEKIIKELQALKAITKELQKVTDQDDRTKLNHDLIK